MRDVHGGGIEAERFRLALRAVEERHGGDEHGRDAARLQVDDVVHTARRARPSIGESLDHGVAPRGDLVANVDRRGLGERRLGEADRRHTARAQQLLEAIEEHVAAGLRDVEKADGLARERGEARDARAHRGSPLAGRIEEDATDGAVRGHGRISFITGSLPVAPLTHPPIIIEKRPAAPPQWTSRKPPGRNFGNVELARCAGAPSAMPPAPRTSSLPDICRSSWRRATTFSLLQPDCRNTRACSGPIASKQSNAMTSFAWCSVRRLAARLRESDSASRDSWSTIARGPSPVNNTTVFVPGAAPKSADKGDQGEPSSSSAQQKAIFPGFPCVARSTSPGRPPPTFRTTSCSARPIVRFARFP